ncbi:MAG: hypothetical protein AAF744_03940 [Pseudomonadota bacterium]
MRQAGKGLLAPLCVALGLSAASGAAAQSAHGCRNLISHEALRAVEGTDGGFFRLIPDLQSHHALSDVSIARIADLSKAMAARGTTLVLLPVPTRAQVMAHTLPAAARDVGYDADISATVHQEMIRRLGVAGVAVADVRQRLRQAALAGEEVFFAADPRPTPQGARIMAQVVADVLGGLSQTAGLPRGGFTTEAMGKTTLPSPTRAQLQLACHGALPPVTAEVTQTTGDAQAAGAAIAAVIGTEIAGTPELNLAGYISEFSGLRAGSYGVTGGGAYAAMSSFLTSRNFEDSTPAVVIWEFPVSAPFGQQGDQPMRELIAAASGSCTMPLGLRPGADGMKLTADLSAVPSERPVTLAFDTGGAVAQQVLFHFEGADGQRRTRGIWRHPDQVLTGRFFVPLSGLQTAGLRAVEVELPLEHGPHPRLSVCLQGGDQ